MDVIGVQEQIILELFAHAEHAKLPHLGSAPLRRLDVLLLQLADSRQVAHRQFRISSQVPHADILHRS